MPEPDQYDQAQHSTKAQHCRAEVFIQEKGWFPIDPADARKVALEEQVALDSDKVMALRERLFGNWEMSWVGFNYARDFTLAGKKNTTKRESAMRGEHGAFGCHRS